jgi:hypothetical protein
MHERQQNINKSNQQKPPTQTSADGTKRQQPSSSQGQRQQQSILPSLSLPKGSGAIRGIGEQFAVNPVTGTASISKLSGTAVIYTTAGS